MQYDISIECIAAAWCTAMLQISGGKLSIFVFTQSHLWWQVVFCSFYDTRSLVFGQCMKLFSTFKSTHGVIFQHISKIKVLIKCKIILLFLFFYLLIVTLHSENIKHLVHNDFNIYLSLFCYVKFTGSMREKKLLSQVVQISAMLPAARPRGYCTAGLAGESKEIPLPDAAASRSWARSLPQPTHAKNR